MIFYQTKMMFPRYHTSLVSTLARLNYSKTKPSVSFISKNITNYAPMVMPSVCVVINIISGEGNPDLDPKLRDNKFKSTVELCKFFGIL